MGESRDHRIESLEIDPNTYETLVHDEKNDISNQWGKDRFIEK